MGPRGEVTGQRWAQGAQLEHEQTGGRSGRADNAPATKASDGPSRVSWSNCLVATAPSTRKHQVAFRKVCLSLLTPSEDGFFI